VQRERQLAPEPFAQRFVGDQTLEVAAATTGSSTAPAIAASASKRSASIACSGAAIAFGGSST
jgi:hypothetical protein